MWTDEQRAHAQDQGWGIFDVWTGKSLDAVILPLRFTPLTPNAQAAMRHVVQRAKMRDPLALAALRHISGTPKGK